MLKRILIRALYISVLILCAVATAGISVLLESKQVAFNNSVIPEEKTVDTSPFPVSVDPQRQTIQEADLLGNHVYETLAQKNQDTNSWSGKLVAFFTNKEWYQNLASPVSRVLVIWPGQRKEEVAENFAAILQWNNAQKEQFLVAISSSEPVMEDGTYYPESYVAHRGATPEEVAALIQEKFKEDILARYTSDVEAQVPLEDALIIASLLEREASDFENMREVSGVIWNRLFVNMPLQLDATLQYVRGGKTNEKTWWPVPKPADKYLKSPYNTYANKGLPPAPIGNPSAAAVLAALNPIATDCIYYFHDDNGNYHCSVTYEDHVKKLKATFGRGS
jgi:cell division protein YceG involved in septum cleavage